ncbi:octanoyl-[acyl-carrier-protein]:protein N-octanoyltransferase LIPT2, mitochondrial isoform X1 [Bacillus rossius redtenbacheri]|uniref:octanoyl-[acyl-carrier-protein]:protein N-octanoyltransferase LIPT2, mitochondrial isoform X1 n=1 Tax=Bacillus rossius redtenbacheri TaxID=93214 RepID=UPI002FDE2493
MVRLVRVLQVGRLCYGSALELQRALAKEHLGAMNSGAWEEAADTLLLLEHEPVYTVGIRSAEYPEEVASKLTHTGAEFCRTDRGGLITFHGPGQLVAYPVLNLKRFQRNVRWYVAQLEEVAIRTCARLGVTAGRCEHTGVWVGDSKICALGVHASRFITTHGLALNCNVDLAWFSHIVPCGIPGKGVTSLSRELARDVPVEEVVPVFLDSFSRLFQCELYDCPRDRAEELLAGIAGEH